MKSKHFLSRSSGFSLLEILVVVMMIGIISGMATIAFTRDLDDELETEARRLYALIKLAEQEAVLRSQELAVSFEYDSYEFLIYDYDTSSWTTVNDNLLRPRHLPDEIYMNITLEGSQVDFIDQQDNESQDKKPRIFILSSGEITPFEIVFRHDQVKNNYVVRGDIDGQLDSGS